MALVKYAHRVSYNPANIVAHGARKILLRIPKPDSHNCTD